MGVTLQPVTSKFNRSLRIESRADRLTGDPGAVVLREILERSGVVGWMTARLKDPRRQEDVTHDLASLIRTSVLLSAQGWRDHDDADALRHDPAFRLAASSAAGLTPLGGPGLASQPSLSRFTALLAEPANLKVLREAVLELAVVDRARKTLCDVAMVRIDAGFPSAALLVGLDARGIDYVSRLRANPVLDRLAEPCMQRPPGRRPAEPRSWLYELRYQADSWDKPRRVILVVKERADDLLLDRFFLVTSLGWTAKLRHEVLAHYRERGKAEGHMGELKDVLAPALSSTNRAKSHWRGKKLKSKTPAVDAFACNEVRLLIACLAYQVMHIARRAMTKATGTGWSLRRLRERVLRAGTRLVISGRRMVLALSSAAAPFWSVLWPRLMALHWADP